MSRLKYLEKRYTLRECLVEWILGRLKNIYMRSENFLEGVWLEGEKEKRWWDLGVFPPNPPKIFLPKMGEN